MTQANTIDTNYQNLNAALIQDVSTPVEAVRPEKFVKALDKFVKDSDEPKTIGDIKAAAKSGDTDNVMSAFNQVVAENVQEMGVEKSLDLTLARDINEIIAQLRNSLNITSENALQEDTADAETTVDEEICDIDEEIADNAPEQDDETDANTVVRDLISLAADFVLPQAAPVVEEAVNKGAEIVNKVLNTNLVMENTKVSEQEIENAATKVIADDSAKEEALSENSDFEIDEDIVKKLNIEVIKAEADTSGNEGFSQQQSAEEYGIKAMIHQTAQTSNVNFENIQTQLTQVKPVEISPEKIIEQITKHLQFNNNPSKIDIVLNPESLGKVSLKLVNTNEGLTAQFTVTTQEARDLIMKGLDGLKSNLLAHGINMDNISVKVSESEKESYNQDWSEQEGSRGGNKEEGHFDRREKEEGLFEKTIAKVFKENEESI